MDEDIVGHNMATNDNQKRVTSDDRLPPKEENSIRKGSVVHDKSQVETEGEPKTKPESRSTKDEEEMASQRMRMNNMNNTKTEVWYDGTTGEGVEKCILSSY